LILRFENHAVKIYGNLQHANVSSYTISNSTIEQEVAEEEVNDNDTEFMLLDRAARNKKESSYKSKGTIQNTEIQPILTDYKLQKL
jgi:hypothetical protein